VPPAALLFVFPLRRRRLRRHIQTRPQTTAPTTARPPTTPPAMAPTLVDEDLWVDVEVAAAADAEDVELEEEVVELLLLDEEVEELKAVSPS
jgi:hypothetical protein